MENKQQISAGGFFGYVKIIHFTYIPAHGLRIMDGGGVAVIDSL